MDSNTGEKPAQDPESRLEQGFIEEYLKAHGHDAASLGALPEPERKHLLIEASTYAATKLAQVEARAHFVHDIRGQQ